MAARGSGEAEAAPPSRSRTMGAPGDGTAAELTAGRRLEESTVDEMTVP